MPIIRGISGAIKNLFGLSTLTQNAVYAATPNWFLSASGSATASGTDSSHPITPAEWSRRLKGVKLTVAGEVLVTYDATGDANNVLRVTCDIYSGTTLRITGTATQAATGTIDTWTAENTATNVGWGITTNAFAAGDWSTHLFQSIRNTTAGARLGVRAFALGDQNVSVPIVAKTCRLPKPYAKNLTYPFSLPSSVTATPFVTGDTYALDNLCQIGGISFEGFIDTMGLGTRIIVDSLKLGYNSTSTAAPPANPAYQQNIVYVDCDLGLAGFNGVNAYLIGCTSSEMFVQNGSSVTAVGCGWSSATAGGRFAAPVVSYGANLLATDCLFIGNQSLECDDGGFISFSTHPSGFFDFVSGGGAILAIGQGRVRTTQDIYGSNVGTVVQCQDGGTFVYQTPTNLKAVGPNAGLCDGKSVNPANIAAWGNATYHDRVTGSTICQHATGGGPNLQVFYFSAATTLLTAVAQAIPPGSGTTTISSDLNVGCLALGLGVQEATSGFLQSLTVRFVGNASNVGGQTVTIQIFKSIQGAAPAAVTGAVTTALATTAGTKSLSVNFTPVGYKSGDVITAVITPSALLTAALTDVMVAVGG